MPIQIEKDTDVGLTRITAMLVRGQWEIFATGAWADRWTKHQVNHRAATAIEILPGYVPITVRLAVFQTLNDYGVDRLIEENRRAMIDWYKKDLAEEQRQLTQSKKMLAAVKTDADLQSFVDRMEAIAFERL